jgi:hypothetical protein
MTDSEFIDKLKMAISTLDQINIFNPTNGIEKIIDESVRYLRFKGFKIIEPKKFKNSITNVDDLIKYFYLLINSKNSNSYILSYNSGKDRAIAKRFVVNRMAATGASKEYALNECGEIIRTVFEYEKEFKFKYAITFSVFGQDNLKWVTDKAIQIMNRNSQEKEEEDAEILREKVIAAQDTSDLGFNDLDDLLAEMGGE